MEVWVRTAIHCFYKRVVVRKQFPIPQDKPLVYCSNHQNAFLDALIIAVVTKTQPASLVRADVFKNPIAKKILNAMKMLPVFRMRDGYNSLSNNDGIFATVRSLLQHNGSIIIFPEGNHGERKQLRPLKKGVGRIVLSTLDTSPELDDIEVVPIGLEYSYYENFRSSVMVEFGEPISVKQFLDNYKENEAKGLLSFNSELKDKISSLMLDIQFKDEYFIVHDFLNDHVLKKHTTAADFTKRFELARKLIQEINSWEADNVTRNELEKWWKSHPEWEELTHSPNRSWLKFLTFFCVIPWIIPYFIIHSVATKVTKDSQFVSSLKMAFGMLLVPIWFLILAGISFAFFSGLQLVGVLIGLIFTFWGSLHFWND